jgi:hypothetical protein
VALKDQNSWRCRYEAIVSRFTYWPRMRRRMRYGTALNYGRNASECIMAQVAMCTSRWAERTALPSAARIMWESEACKLRVVCWWYFRGAKAGPSVLPCSRRKSAKKGRGDCASQRRNTFICLQGISGRRRRALESALHMLTQVSGVGTARPSAMQR